MRPSTERVVVGITLALALITLGLQALVLRPRLWPAGPGLALSGDIVFGLHAAPRPVAVIRPPDAGAAAGAPVVTQVFPGSAADRAGVRVGDQAFELSLSAPPFTPGASPFSADAAVLDLGWTPGTADLLLRWRLLQQVSGWLRTSGAGNAVATVDLKQPPIWFADNRPWGPWLRLHLGPIAQTAAFLAGAAVLLLLGARGTTAALMTLALIATAAANGGPLLGSHQVLPVIGPVVLWFTWLITPLSFPIIGLAVLFFPSRAEILDRHRWIVPAVIAACVPMLVISITSAAFLSGVDGVLPLLSWFAERGWTFEASFALCLAVNVLIVVEGIQRYRVNLDANERRRIQIVVYTGVPAVFAYALKTGIPLLLGLLGRPVELPWPIEALLQAIILLPAFGLPYAVAVRHVFSPRTVLRRSLQYAFARRTLAALVALPVIALIASLVQQRDQSLSMIVTGRPLFYLFFLAMLAVGLKYRDAAQRWLDRQFFRAEYDAREILVSLAGRVPYEADPAVLVATVVSQIDSALHPENIAVLASDAPTATSPGGKFTPVSARRVDATPLSPDSGIITLLRWSDKPLEVFLDDEQSPVARVPQQDRLWLAAMNTALLVPIFAGGSEPRPFVGLIALGAKRSEEPYTAEDRELLRGIAVQMGVGIDLSRLRKQVNTMAPARSAEALAEADHTVTPTVIRGGAGAAMAVGTIIDGKYRVDAVIGQGGMGAVFRAWDLRLERAVAIKVVRADLLSDPDSRARFRRESQIVARLQHPSIVTVFDYGTLPDGAAFLVMEFVPGEDLRHLMKREGRLAAARTAELLNGICAGVESAHKSGIFHRDLKPENILLPESGTGPKVLDFGVAKLTDTANTTGGGTLTAGGTIVGTPAYMSPEQLRGDAVDARTDVFSLGVMTYEMLLGRLPYGGGSFIDIGVKQAAGEMTVECGDLPARLADVVRRAIAYDKQKRPSSPVAFANDVRAAL
jgi:GAF domain-containing protein/predicted Ser/Thr protein kinase